MKVFIRLDVIACAVSVQRALTDRATRDLPKDYLFIRPFKAKKFAKQGIDWMHVPQS